ncbi:MAG: helix-turn-helix domain-containing protein [Acidimicrobiales bacterium]
MSDLPEGWDEYDPDHHERRDEPSYRAARSEAASHAEARRAAYGEALAALRRALALTQVVVAERLGVAQSEVSRIEHQADLLLSTMVRYIESMDAELALVVRFGNGQTIELGAVLEDLIRQDPPEGAAVSNLATIIRLAEYRGRYPYKEAAFRAGATACTVPTVRHPGRT